MSVDLLDAKAAIIYPESDGQPMAENTKQFRWTVTIVEGLRASFVITRWSSLPETCSGIPWKAHPIFVAFLMRWWFLVGQRATVAHIFSGLRRILRRKRFFEVLLPGNTYSEMAQKFEFYDTYGVEEYYLYDPDRNNLSGWQRRDGRLRVITPIEGWTSPRLGVRFVLNGDELQIIRPDGQRFLTYEELNIQFEQERAARLQAEQRAEQLAARLRALGVDPEG